MNTSQRLNCFILEGKLFVTCESAAEERTAHSSTGGALIFWLLPIVVVVVVDTQVHCELGHLSSHSGSQQIPALRGAGNRALYGDNSTAERQTTKQMSASYFTLYHRLSISFSTLHLSLSLSLYAIFRQHCLILFRQQ